MQLKEKEAVVTGASSGIRKALALAFASAGAAIVVTYRSHPEEAEDFADQIKSTGGKAVTVRADVTKPRDVRALIQRAVGISDSSTAW